MSIAEVKPYTLPIVPGLTITSGAQVISPNTMLAMLLWATPGMGKTRLAGSLNRLTLKHYGRPTVYIPVEEGEGGGTASIRDLDVPMIIPKDYSDLSKILGSLRNDKTFAGIVLDSATEVVQKHIKPVALRYPPKENLATRQIGVPTRSDYQVMGEMTSGVFRQLMQMTTHEKPEFRKHLIITATQKEIEEDDKVNWRGPALPGAMASAACAMFQIVGMLRAKTEVVGGRRQIGRYLITEGDGVNQIKDRYEVFPSEVKICKTYTDGSDGEDLCSLWEKYWIPAIKQS